MVSSPAIMRSSVVLPEPDGPRKTTNSPVAIVSDTSWMTCTAPKLLQTFRNEISAKLSP